MKNKFGIIIIILSVLIIAGVFSLLMFDDFKSEPDIELVDDITPINIEEQHICNDRLEHHVQVVEYDVTLVNEDFENRISKSSVLTYLEYEKYCSEFGLIRKYDNKEQNYIVFSEIPKVDNAEYASDLEAELLHFTSNQFDSATLYIMYNDYTPRLETDSVDVCVITIPTNLNVDTNINVIQNETNESETDANKSPGVNWDDVVISGDAVKPIIYLYPTAETVINVTLDYPENITHSYPKYKNGWTVLAQPNGDLEYLETGRQLYSLYYENKNKINFSVTTDGFIVKGKDTVSFLEEKLAILGLSEHEAEEFIIYWLPILESNEYNYIRFATTDELNKNMPLNVHPQPDSIIRVLMIYKGIDEPFDVVEQKLTTPKRTGFVVVEWGGTEIR